MAPTRSSLKWLAVPALFVAVVPSSSFGLAELNDSFSLPSGLANDVVRVGEVAGQTAQKGSGIILSVVPDGSGGDWYNVLTADHVVYDAVKVATTQQLVQTPWSITMGFRFDQTFPLSVANVKNVALDGAGTDGMGDGPDLALFSIHLTASLIANPPANVLAPPSLLQPVNITAPDNSAGNQIVQAGFGSQATAGSGAPYPAGTSWYKALGNFGTYESAANTISTTGLVANFVGAKNPRVNGGSYTFNAIQGSYAFTLDGSSNITAGTSYVLQGDSGGPTFESNGQGGFSLIGVHSSDVQDTATNGDVYVPAGQGYLWSDVQLSSYTTWINQTIPLIDVDVPEPSARDLVALGGLVFLVGAWRRTARRRA
ncbi:MAG TPA: hypothetical protein VMP11_02215 [Verrucomicrobiae bacterium]|nr:hypothetical protein [Verrucomicrobiae bacterium]